jgi:hypothetical protein
MGKLGRNLLRKCRPVVNRLFTLNSQLVRKANPEWHPRTWSNSKLRKIAHLYDGSVINVSGWQDMDKEGKRYQEYFLNAKEYHISNIEGCRGKSDLPNEISIDLQSEVAAEMADRYDVVFNHTTLEHVFDIKLAFKNLCKLTRDTVILVVPFMQVEHWAYGSYLDYFRFTEFALRELLGEQNLDVMYINGNHKPVYPVYYFVVASKRPEKWANRFPQAGRDVTSGIIRTHNVSSYRSLGDFEIMK